MEKMPLEMLNAERDKELFEYEMTEVRAALQEEFEKVQNLAPACENIDEVLPPEGVSVQTETVIPDHVDMKKLFLDIQPAEAKAKGAMPDHVDMTNPSLTIQPAEVKAKGIVPDKVEVRVPQYSVKTESLLTVEYRYQPFETMAFEEPDTQRVMEEVSAIQNAMQQSFAAKNEKIAEIMEMEFETPDISGSVADILLSCKENGMKIASGAGAN